MTDNLFQIYSKLNLVNRDEVYQFLAEKNQKANSINELALVEAFYEREKKGNIQIDEGVVLPHIEDERILETSVMIISLSEPIKKWNSTIENIDLIIAVLLSPQEKTETKKKISNFMRKLADEDFLNKLKMLTDSQDLNIN